jgi:membrane protein implicated in regulation of membrane protease activity
MEQAPHPVHSSEVHLLFLRSLLTIAIVGGVIGFLILALIVVSVVLYILVRRSVEKRARDREFLRESKLYNEEPRSSVAASASDTPEEELREMEPSFWGVVTRPKQALRVVNG